MWSDSLSTSIVMPLSFYVQMAESLGSKSIGAFVALVSIWNFLGRMGAGYVYMRHNMLDFMIVLNHEMNSLP